MNTKTTQRVFFPHLRFVGELPDWAKNTRRGASMTLPAGTISPSRRRDIGRRARESGRRLREALASA